MKELLIVKLVTQLRPPVTGMAPCAANGAPAWWGRPAGSEARAVPPWGPHSARSQPAETQAGTSSGKRPYFSETAGGTCPLHGDAH